jgi:foldase protein PrsA
MHRLSRLLLLLALPAALALSACGDNVPGNAVVKVDDDLIEKRTFDKWVRIAAISAQGATAPAANGQPPKAQVPQPPDFAECVATKKRTAPKPAKGQPAPKDADFRNQCRQEYEGLRDQVLQLLINEKWVTGEAAQQNVSLSDAEVRKTFEQQKKQSFPKEADYREFLKTSGFTEDDILFRIRLEQLSIKLRDKVIKGKDKVSDQQIQAYYNRNKARFARPEQRDLRVVLARSESRAKQAQRALDGGDSFRSVARRFSIDDASKSTGGVLNAVGKGSGQLEPAVERAVFAAERGELTGPVKSQFGFYVFEVTKVTPPSQQTLQQAKPTIQGILAQENQQKALDRFIKDYQQEWREKTTCQEGFTIADVCENGPTTDTSSTGAAAPGGAPQQPAQPGQPAQPAQPGQPAQPAQPAQPPAE